MNNNSFKAFIEKIKELPIWTRQVLYTELKEEFEKDPVKECLGSMKKEDIFQLYVPKITLIGKRELETRAKKLQPNSYLLLEATFENLNIMEITIKNNWSFDECSLYFIEALNFDLISIPESPAVKGTALYLSSKIRLGEYFVKLGKITIEQLDEALRNQKYIEKTVGDKRGLAEVLINLGFITKHDTDGILLLKEEAKKRYIPDNIGGGSSGNPDEMTMLKEQLNKLMKENNQLKEQIRKILKI